MIGKTIKADRLMQAMAQHEGWMSVAADPQQRGSRAYRHHNPGNLRASPFAEGIVENFAVFRNDIVGWQAFHWDLLQKARGNTSTGLNGQSTLRDLLFKWAPPSDNNDTEAYVRAVEKSSGLTASTTLKEIFDL